jgi:hypothetical protein
VKPGNSNVTSHSPRSWFFYGRQGTYCRHNSRLMAIIQVNQWQRGIYTRHLQSLIHAQEDRSIDGELDI